MASPRPPIATVTAPAREVAVHLYPGERVLHCVRGLERPAWAAGLLAIGALVRRECLIVATERRLLLIVHKTRFGEESFASVAWGELENAELVGSPVGRTLRISAHGGRWRREFRVRPSYEAHEGIVSLWRSLFGLEPRR
jgi:hypothetical protein